MRVDKAVPVEVLRRDYREPDRAILAALIVWAYQGPSWLTVGEA